MITWRIGEDESQEPDPPEPQRPFLGPLLFLLLTAVLVGGVLSAWYAGQRQIERSEADLRRQVQTVLDLQQRAVQRGDGDLFFSVVADDPAFRAAQLLPANVDPHRAGLTVTRAWLRDGIVQANLRWTANGKTYQRIAFYRLRSADLRQIPTTPDYWGDSIVRQTAWGRLEISEVDAAWATDIAAFVRREKARLCDTDCPERALTVAVRPDFGTTAVPHTVYVPSPRLLGLDETGAPSDRFWDALRRELAAQTAPVTIRFALPPKLPVGIHLVEYEQAAADFMARHPAITIELVELDALPTDPAQLAGFDGAAFPPTVDLIAAGAVRDLTDFAATDLDFDHVDFYGQIWQGTQWRDRMWLVPQAAEMQLLFYDRDAYAAAGLMAPSLRWTWAEMEADLAALDETLPFEERPFPTYRFYDVSSDILYAHTLGHGGLTPTNVAQSLQWYADMARHPRLMPDVTTFSDAERELYRFRWWAPLWVDRLVYYEHWQQIVGNLGVVPFPGSAQFDGVTPLHLYGGFITADSAHPRAVWQWLAFLSYQPTAPRYRLIPARPSVAQATGYWSTLPRPLSEPLRVAFPFAQAVTLTPHPAFGWEAVTAVVANQRTPSQAAQQSADLPWFTAR